MRSCTVFLVSLLAGCSVHPQTSVDPDAGSERGTDAGTDVDAPSGGDAAVHTAPISVLVGVDRASAFSTTEAHALKALHNVGWTGVYIGGACSAGSGWTKAQVTPLHTAAAWKFMPVYVGQQSASICGAHDLSATRGHTDGLDAVARMQAFGWAAHRSIPVALDLEANSYTSSPAGSQAYVRAWRDAVRGAGYLAYVYSNPTGINGLYDAGVKLDGAWPASWFYTSFHAGLKAEDLTQLGTRYTQKNRAWQFAGDFAVSGAGSVDGNVCDLVLAPEPGGTNL